MMYKTATTVRSQTTTQPAVQTGPQGPIRWQLVVTSGIARPDAARKCSWVCRTDTAPASSVPRRPHFLSSSPVDAPSDQSMASHQTRELAQKLKPPLLSVQRTIQSVVQQVRQSNHLSLDDVKRLAGAAEILAKISRWLDEAQLAGDRKTNTIQVGPKSNQPKSSISAKTLPVDSVEEIPGAELVSEIIKHWKVVQSKLAHLDSTIAMKR